MSGTGSEQWVQDTVADMDMPVAADQAGIPGVSQLRRGVTLGAAGQVLWVTPAEGTWLSLCDAASICGPDLQPLPPGLWVRAKTDTGIEVRATDDLDPDVCVRATAAFTAALVPLFEARADQADLAVRERLEFGAEAAKTGGSTELEAVRAIAGWFGVDASLPASARGSIPFLARRFGLRARRVTLGRDWSRQDHGPLIVQRGDDLDPLIRRGRGWSAASVQRDDMTTAADVASAAWSLSPPLGQGLTRFLPMARQALAGSGGDIAFTAAAAAGVALVGLLMPMATGWLLGGVVPAGNAGLLVAVGIGLISAAVISTLFSVVREVAAARIEGRSTMRMAAGLADRVLRLPATFFKDFAAGDLNQRLINVDQMRGLAISVALSSGLTAGLSLIYLVALFVYDARLAALAVLLAAGYVAAVALARVLQMPALREAARIDGDIAAMTHETLEGVAKLRLAAAEDRALARWHALYRRERDAQIDAGRITAHFSAFAETYQTITLIALFAAAVLLSTSDIQPGTFVAFLAAFGVFQGAVAGLADAVLQIYAAQPLVERARPVLDAKPEAPAGRADPGNLLGRVEAEGLSFAYAPGLPPVLSGLSLTVNPGEHVAIVGGSGSGKSTLLRLLLGFETPQAGSITYDGQDLTRVDLTAVRSQIGVVLQASQLFAGTILENIRGAGEADLETCMEAAARAGLAPDLAYFAMGLHTPLTEGGAALSGGQRQRILIARALAAEPRLLFFDEATSALDNQTQAEVAASLEAMTITRITIAHRLSTVRNADRICVLEGGRFVEQGGFQELMALDGVFATLARRQLIDHGAG